MKFLFPCVALTVLMVSCEQEEAPKAIVVEEEETVVSSDEEAEPPVAIVVDEEELNEVAEEEAETVGDRVDDAIDFAEKRYSKVSEKTEKGIRTAVEKAEGGVGTAAENTGRFLQRVGDKIEKAATGEDEETE